MKKYIYSILAATAFVAAGCSDNDVVENLIPDEQKDVIEFSLSDAAASSTRAGFGGSATFVAMRMQSNEKGGSGVKYTRTVATAAKDETNPTTATSFSNVTFTDDNKRYWDDAHGRKSLLSVFAVAIPNNATDSKGLENKLSKGDASAKWGTSGTNTIEWSITTDKQTKDASTENTAAVSTGTIDNEDLVYSNNIQAGKKDGVYRWDGTTYDPSNTGATTHHDGQMLFFQDGMTDATALSTAITDAPGHFDKGHLVFNHALTRLTIQLVEGAGFDSGSAADFQFTKETSASAVTNITLLNMFTSGTLDLAAGTWGSKSSGNITQIAGSTTAAANTFCAQVLPDYVIADGSNTNVMKFTIDNNTYFITQDMLFDALAGDNNNKIADYGYDETNNNKFTLMQGKNYKFKITVDKTQIANMTATLTPWVNVTAADFGLDNRHVEFSFLDNATGEACTAGINFYQKTEDLEAIYTDNSYITAGKGVAFSGDYLTKGEATLTLDGGKYKTNWYYEDNKTAYHFRTISDNAETVIQASSDPTYFTMTGASTMPDYHWGAPMKTTANLAYDPTSSNGYKANIHEGLTSTASDIKITEMHMMSNLNITLETTTGSDKVVLSGATIKLTRLANTGTVDMGTGYITPAAPVTEVTMATPSNYWETTDVKTKAFQYAVVPQPLVRQSGDNGYDSSKTGANDNDNYIGITITTSDNNQYYVIRKLSEILITDIKKGTTDPYADPDHPKDGSGNYQNITRWYPNHTYSYNIKITKKGIEAITATVTKWVDVTAKDINIDLES